MKVKKTVSIILLIAITVTISGCSNAKTKENNQNQESTNITSSSINTDAYNRGYLTIPEEEIKDMEKMSCTREANGEEGAKVNLTYTLYYQGEYLQILHSKEQIITEKQDILDEYQKAYINIYRNYEDLEYYETSVVREKNSVTNDTVINYSKLDTNKLLEIEGEEDNIIKDGKVRLDDWLEFGKQFGIKCE